MVVCNISFDNNPHGVYFSGQTVSGTIEITNEKSRKIRGIALRIEGFAMCNWTETHGTGKDRKTTHYYGREDYLSTYNYLFGGSSENQIEFPQGVHKFTFISVLPPQLPTSFESKYGHIRYHIKVEIERPWKFDFKYCFGLTVIKPLDLNFENPQLRVPFKTETSKKFFLGFSNKSLHLSAQIPFCGYVSGQTVSVSVSVNNETKIDVYGVTVELMKVIQYNCDYPMIRTRKREERVAWTSLPAINANSKQDLYTALVVPAVPPTNFGTCRPVQVYYEIQVIARTSGLHRNIILALPVTVGTVPLNSYQNIYPSLPVEPLQAAAYSQQSQIPSAPSVIDLPPPTYQEAMMTTTKEMDNDEAMNVEIPYSPRYPVFNFANQNAMGLPKPSAPAYGGYEKN